ncbi:MAG: PHP domain-containing protein [Candidatus Eisenbacteria bacterium]|nr:PHP domain-containing protein [Candidatus Eisenbacteria bacterium]
MGEAMGGIDLHVHTTASDGSLTPSEVVARASGLGLAAIAVTDHDSVGGVPEALAAGARHGLEVVPGVEIGIAHEPGRGLVEVDILGYFVDHSDPELRDVLARMQAAKNGKLARQVEVLAAHGYPIDAAEVEREAAGDTVRRPHIWKVLHRHHAGLEAQEFFDRTSFGGEWHVPKSFGVTLEECVALIGRAGGVPVVAHPGCYSAAFDGGGSLIDPAVDAVIAVCAGAGVRGVEVYYPYDRSRPHGDGRPLMTAAELASVHEHYASEAGRHGLVATGGTDFHGASKPEIEIGDVPVPYGVLTALRAARPLPSS